MNYSEQLEAHVKKLEDVISDQLREIDKLQQQIRSLSDGQAPGSLMLNMRDFNGCMVRQVVDIRLLENNSEYLIYAYKELCHHLEQERKRRMLELSRTIYRNLIATPSGPMINGI